MKMMFYDPSSSLTDGLLMSFQQGGGWVDEEEEWGWMVVVEGCCTRCTHAHSDQLPLCYLESGGSEDRSPLDADESVCPFLSTETEKKKNKEEGQYR